MGCYSSRIYVIDPSEKVHLNPIVPGVPEENSSQVKAVHKQSQGQGPDNTEVLVGGTRHFYNQFGQLRPARAEKSCIVCSVFKRPPQTVYELNRALEPEREPRVCLGPRESTVRASPSPSAPPAPSSLYPDISKVAPPPSPSSFIPPIADLVERRLQIVRQEEDRARSKHISRCRSFIDRCKSRCRPSPCKPTSGRSRPGASGRRVQFAEAAGPNHKAGKNNKKAKNVPRKNKNKSKKPRGNNKNFN